MSTPRLVRGRSEWFEQHTVDDANKTGDQDEDKGDESKPEGQSGGNEDIEEVHQVVVSPVITALAQTLTLQISF